MWKRFTSPWRYSASMPVEPSARCARAISPRRSVSSSTVRNGCSIVRACTSSGFHSGAPPVGRQRSPGVPRRSGAHPEINLLKPTGGAGASGAWSSAVAGASIGWEAGGGSEARLGSWVLLALGSRPARRLPSALLLARAAAEEPARGRSPTGGLSGGSGALAARPGRRVDSCLGCLLAGGPWERRGPSPADSATGSLSAAVAAAAAASGPGRGFVARVCGPCGGAPVGTGACIAGIRFRRRPSLSAWCSVAGRACFR